MARILIIEDDRMFLDDLVCLIEAEGHESFYCRSEDDFWSNVDNVKKADKIILDLMMKRGENAKILPSEESLDAGEIIFKRIRNKYPDKEIVIITAKTSHDIKIDLSSPSLVKVFTKPMTELKMAELLKLL